MNDLSRAKPYHLLGRFRRDRKGNVAIIFALATIPIIGFVGAAVDYSHANSVKVAMQAALDSTALMLSKDVDKLTSDQLNARALEIFNVLFTRDEAANITVKATYTTQGGSQVTVDGSVDVPTDFMGTFGFHKLTVGNSATAKWGMERLRVALVLDNTGSMDEDGKMTALKSATKSLLTQLKGAATNNGDVYVSIIPFNRDVNIGSTNYNASYIDWNDWEDDNGTCSSPGRRRGGGCSSSNWTPANHNTWNGCITDRGPPNAPGTSTWDQVVTLPDGTTNSLWPADQYGSCPVELMGLTYNWTALNGKVDSMNAVGSTNQPIGLVWGWQSLVGGGPLTAPAKDSTYQYKEYIILLSDGINTQDRWFGNDPNASNAVDNRMYQTGNGSGTCANIKAAGITIYAIQVNTGSDPTSTVMQNCASSSDKFYLLTSANDISATFDAIGTDMTKLRVAQ